MFTKAEICSQRVKEWGGVGEFPGVEETEWRREGVYLVAPIAFYRRAVLSTAGATMHHISKPSHSQSEPFRW